MGPGAAPPPPSAHSLADTKASEDFSEQILTGYCAGNLAKRPLSEPKILREKLQSPRRSRGLRRVLDELASARQRIEMPPARRQRTRFRIEVAGARFQMRSQRIEAGPGVGAHEQAGRLSF